MLEVLAALPAYFLVFSFFYVFYFRHIISDKRAKYASANRILAFVDGLYFSELEDLLQRPYCFFPDLRAYVEDQLIKVQRTSTNKSPIAIEFVTSSGVRYSSFGGESDYAAFAIICIANYANEFDNVDLLLWCESRLRRADVWHCSAHFPKYYTQ